MKRVLTIAAVAALIIGVSLPAAAIANDPVAGYPVAQGREPAEGQEVDIRVEVAAASRDSYSAEHKPPPEPTYAGSWWSGTVPAEYIGTISVWPANGPLGSPFGPRWGGASGFHYGIDIMAGHGTEIWAAGSGVVSRVDANWGWGNFVVIDHGNGVTTLYSHLSGVALGAGTPVSAGTLIGWVGNSGNAEVSHLHFETAINGVQVDPMGFFG